MHTNQAYLAGFDVGQSKPWNYKHPRFVNTSMRHCFRGLIDMYISNAQNSRSQPAFLFPGPARKASGSMCVQPVLHTVTSGSTLQSVIPTNPGPGLASNCAKSHLSRLPIYLHGNTKKSKFRCSISNYPSFAKTRRDSVHGRKFNCPTQMQTREHSSE